MNQRFDVIVIGGGVNGCGLARDLALRGMSVCLVEKGDLAMGTSWASSGMLHGGLRYLLSDVGTTYKSCKDSGYIRKIAPHLIFRIPMMMPIRKDEGISGRINLAGADALFAHYDFYQPLKGGQPHVRLSASEALRIEPLLFPGLIGAVATDEWGIDMPRLCVANALDAAEHGAAVRTWTQVENILLENQRVTGVVCRDRIKGTQETIGARMVVNCAGPWAPQVARLAGAVVRLRSAKGVHLVLDRRFSNVGIITRAIDGRQIFMIPHENVSLIGTTDDDYYGDLDDLRVTEDEIEYLLEAMERVIPRIREARVVKTMAGVRPTLFENAKYEDDLTRDHRVFDHFETEGVEGFVTLAGGKLAAYRVMAQDCADTVARKLNNQVPCRTHELSLPGGEEQPDAEALAKEHGLDPLAVRRLVFRQGSRAGRVLELLKENPNLGQPLCLCEPVLEAEARYVIRHEFVRRASDLIGRCRIAEGGCQGMGCAAAAAQVFGEERGLGAAEIIEEAIHILQEKWRWRREVLTGVHAAQEELYRLVHAALLGPAARPGARPEVF